MDLLKRDRLVCYSCTELAAGRQIGHEIIKTFNPKYQKRPNLPPSGVIVAGNALFQMSEEEARKLQRQPTQILAPPRPAAPKAGRNQPCPCGSGMQFKKCHGK